MIAQWDLKPSVIRVYCCNHFGCFHKDSKGVNLGLRLKIAEFLNQRSFVRYFNTKLTNRVGTPFSNINT